jgi:GNAT superfamily N-acetyltransferase
MHLGFSMAGPNDAHALAALQTASAAALTERFGQGPWSSPATERGVLFGMRHARVVIARIGEEIVGTLRLQTKKPWAIDVAYFTPVRKSIYLTSMAVKPDLQRSGVGRELLKEAAKEARSWPGGAGFALRLDAYEGEGGAGEFYSRCGFTERGRVSYRKSRLIYYELIL